jgi:hypothetical protein
MTLNSGQLREKYSEQSDVLRRQLKEKEDILKKYRLEHGKLDLFFQALAKELRPIEPIRYIYKKSKIKGSPVTAVMQISDTHMGAVQVAEEIENFNLFNPDVCRDRQIAYAKKFIDWIELHRTVYNIPEASVLVTGDLISGDIHLELQVTNAFPVPVQCVRSAEVLSEQIALISPYFKKVIVHFIVADNHGRLTKKPQAKEEGYNSYNYIVGNLAKLYLQRFDNVEFNIYPMLEKVIQVSTRQYLISHGHNIKGWMGIPWYGVERHVGREAMTRMEIIMNELSRMKEIGFHKYVFGHYHTPFDHPHYSCCGSVSGTDAYDHKAGRHADPSQSSWLVHPKHGEFNRINFNLKYIA